ncbi:energy transducer TonB [Sphingomonas spermidinifaciens]|uniref:Energy transducer TonB n=1 Tax=Sphingomonas spermidinifaciens TaxID=1141889 RepID=A0A2A4B3E4_9SPHN|nr:TonB family protein [Sphingomonas spermidinifaciens]PCD02475.1 energy transducer TonB [Sphingomonas spermidinifaciens]
MTATLAVGQAVPVAPPAPPVPPPIQDGATPPRPDPELLRWVPGPVRCADGPVEAAPIRRPGNTLRYGSGPATQAPVELRFAIAADGRPVSIDRAPGGYRYHPDDLLPALAASRFPAAARRDCSITYSPVSTPLGEAPVAELVSYTINPRSGRLPREGWDRIRPAGNCADRPRPGALMRAMPDFRNIAGTPGVQDWSLVAYDTDAAGKPTGVRAVEGTGNRALDAASVKAMRASRFSGGARTGCVYPYWRTADTLPAPPMPDAVAAPSPTCPDGRDWAKAPTLTFPEPYRRRRIEGWAIVRYDVAPWGEIGNLTVVAAEPTADFGRQATQMLRMARLKPSAQGRSGCIDRVKFVMTPADAPPADPDDAARFY